MLLRAIWFIRSILFGGAKLSSRPLFHVSEFCPFLNIFAHRPLPSLSLELITSLPLTYWQYYIKYQAAPQAAGAPKKASGKKSFDGEYKRGKTVSSIISCNHFIATMNRVPAAAIMGIDEGNHGRCWFKINWRDIRTSQLRLVKLMASWRGGLLERAIRSIGRQHISCHFIQWPIIIYTWWSIVMQ